MGRTAWLLCLAEDDIPEAERPFVEYSPARAPVVDFTSNARGYSR